MEDGSLNKTNTGSVNERGLINDLNKRGFSDFNSLCEIYANSLEDKVGATDIKTIVACDYIYISDNGVGMNKEAIDNMWSLFRENNNENKSLGVSGLGAKAATKILSRNKEINYYTYNNSIWRKVKVPWDEIVENGVYSGVVECEELDNNSNEIKELKVLNINKGTTLRLPYNEDVDIEIRKHFTDEKKNISKYDERLDFIFGKFTQKMKLYHEHLDYNNKTLVPYDYFTKQNLAYYDGISVQEILVLKGENNTNRFIWNSNPECNEGLEFKTLNKTTQTKPTQVRYNVNDIIGNIYIRTAIFKNKKITLKLNKNTGKVEYSGFEIPDINDYDCNYFDFKQSKNVITQELVKVPLIRNKQMVCSFALDDFKGSTCRGSKEATLKCVGLRSEIEYETISSQDSVLDKVFGIQSNKIQLNEGEISKSLMRLINLIKQTRWEEVNKYIKQDVYSLIDKMFSARQIIQAALYRRLAIKEVEYKNKIYSVSKVQALFRKKKAVTEVKKLKAVLKIQAVFHRKKVLKDIAKTNAAIKLQKIVRRRKALKDIKKAKAGNTLKGFLYGKKVRKEIVNMYPEVLKKKEAIKQIQAVLHRRQAQKQVEEKKTLIYRTGVSKLSNFLYNKNMVDTKINLIKNINRNVNEIKEQKKLLESFENISKYCEKIHPEHYNILTTIFNSIERDFI